MHVEKVNYRTPIIGISTQIFVVAMYKLVVLVKLHKIPLEFTCPTTKIENF